MKFKISIICLQFFITKVLLDNNDNNYNIVKKSFKDKKIITIEDLK